MPAQNPIISGFAPDPSITRIDDTFFLVNSSFHLFPGIPIYASTDLEHWKHIGNGINRSSQLSLSKSRTLVHRGGETILVGTGGLWAPTIRHHQGTTYIICTNVIHAETDGEKGKPVWPSFENFIIRTNDVWSGRWSDPVFFDFNGIDPDLFFDEDGRAYVTGSSWNTNPGTINGFEIDIETGSKVSEEKICWEGVIKYIPEGPHVYKRNDWYFLLIAEGGTHDNHQMSIARSKNPLGPYESCERNPILKPTANLRTNVVYTGHGDLFQDVDNRWWLTCLGVRKHEDRDSIMGRETFLTPVKWAEGGSEDPWPVIEQPIVRTVSLPTPSTLPASLPLDKVNLASQAGLDYVWIRDPDMASYKTSWSEQLVSLKPSSTDLKGEGSEPITFIGKRQREIAGEARAVLSLASLRGQNNLSGLVYYKDEHRHASVAFDSAVSAVVFEVVNMGKREPILEREVVPMDSERTGHGPIEFLLVYTERSLEFSYRLRSVSNDGGEGHVPKASWILVGTVNTSTLTDHDFTGPCIGLMATFATASTGPVSADARWSEFSEVSLDV